MTRSTYDFGFQFSLVLKCSYDSNYNSDSDYIASENQPLVDTLYRCTHFEGSIKKYSLEFTTLWHNTSFSPFNAVQLQEKKA